MEGALTECMWVSTGNLHHLVPLQLRDSPGSQLLVALLHPVAQVGACPAPREQLPIIWETFCNNFKYYCVLMKSIFLVNVCICTWTWVHFLMWCVCVCVCVFEYIIHICVQACGVCEHTCMCVWYVMCGDGDGWGRLTTHGCRMELVTGNVSHSLASEGCPYH